MWLLLPDGQRARREACGSGAHASRRPGPAPPRPPLSLPQPMVNAQGHNVSARPRGRALTQPYDELSLIELLVRTFPTSVFCKGLMNKWFVNYCKQGTLQEGAKRRFVMGARGPFSALQIILMLRKPYDMIV